MHLSETFRYLYSYSGEGLNSLESQLRLTVVLGFLHSLIYPTISYCGYFWCAPVWDFQVFLLLVKRGSELFGVSAQTDSGIRFSASLLYPTISYCGYFWCAPVWDFQVFVLLVRRGSELFVVSAQADSGIRISSIPLNPLPEVIVPISDVQTVWDFQVFLLLVRSRVLTLWSLSSDWQWY